jgi:hypothetical protein
MREERVISTRDSDIREREREREREKWCVRIFRFCMDAKEVKPLAIRTRSVRCEFHADR